jgi:cation diffusion facilitator CzcD-associated flavoprotein CzcO
MSAEKVDTLVVGGGQAGLAMSEHLSKCGVPHLVLERARIAERWRSERWDSLVANGPAWHDRFPGMEFPDIDPSCPSASPCPLGTADRCLRSQHVTVKHIHQQVNVTEGGQAVVAGDTVTRGPGDDGGG